MKECIEKWMKEWMKEKMKEWMKERFLLLLHALLHLHVFLHLLVLLLFQLLHALLLLQVLTLLHVHCSPTPSCSPTPPYSPPPFSPILHFLLPSMFTYSSIFSYPPCSPTPSCSPSPPYSPYYPILHILSSMFSYSFMFFSAMFSYSILSYSFRFSYSSMFFYSFMFTYLPHWIFLTPVDKFLVSYSAIYISGSYISWTIPLNLTSCPSLNSWLGVKLREGRVFLLAGSESRALNWELSFSDQQSSLS